MICFCSCHILYSCDITYCFLTQDVKEKNAAKAKLRRLCEDKAKHGEAPKLQVPAWLHKEWKQRDHLEMAMEYRDCGFDKDCMTLSKYLSPKNGFTIYYNMCFCLPPTHVIDPSDSIAISPKKLSHIKAFSAVSSMRLIGEIHQASGKDCDKRGKPQEHSGGGLV